MTPEQLVHEDWLTIRDFCYKRWQDNYQSTVTWEDYWKRWGTDLLQKKLDLTIKKLS